MYGQPREFYKVKRERIYKAAVLIITVLALAFTVYTYVYEKTGEHSDEIWSYGLANSHYRPHIFLDEITAEYTVDNTWITGNELKEYITVQEDERFDYKSTIYNLAHDSHPPLYFLILHTICSFFPESYSRYYAFSINIVSFLAAAYFLYRLSEKLLKNRMLTVTVQAVYFFGAAGVSNFIFCRQYALVTAITLAFVYYSLKMLESSDKRKFIRNASITVILSFLGCQTIYLFVVFAFVFAACTCVWLLRNKEIKRMLGYGAGMLAGALTVVLSPGVRYAIETRVGNDTDVSGEVLSESTGSLLLPEEFLDKLKTCLEALTKDVMGLEMPDDLLYTARFLTATLGLVFAVTLPIIVLTVIRKRNRIKDSAVNVFRNIKEKKLHCSKPETLVVLAIAAEIPVMAYAVLITTQNNEMGSYTDRYLFNIMPLLVLLIAIVLLKLSGFIVGVIKRTAEKLRNCTSEKETDTQSLPVGILASVVLLIIGINSAIQENQYTFPRVENEESIEEFVKDKDCVLALSNEWLITCYSDILCEADDIFVTTSAALKAGELGESSVPEEEFYLIVDITKFALIEQLKSGEEEPEREAIETYFMQEAEKLYENRNIDYIMQDIIFGRYIYVYNVTG